MPKINRQLARLVKVVSLSIMPGEVPPRHRPAVLSRFVLDCRTEFPTARSVTVAYRSGLTTNSGFVELAGELKDRRPEDDMQTAVLLYAFGLFTAAVTAVQKEADRCASEPPKPT